MKYNYIMSIGGGVGGGGRGGGKLQALVYDILLGGRCRKAVLEMWGGGTKNSVRFTD